MLGAYFGYFYLTTVRLPFAVAFPLAALTTCILAIFIERGAYKPLRERKAPFLYFIISAMGASIFLENIVIATIGPTFRSYPEIFSRTPIKIGTASIGRVDMAMFIVSAICLVLLVYFIDYTKIGKAIQATSYSAKASALMGINTDIVYNSGVCIGVFLQSCQSIVA